MLDFFTLWQEQYANYLESAVDNDEPIVTYAEWFATRRHIIWSPRRREYVWLAEETNSEDENVV